MNEHGLYALGQVATTTPDHEEQIASVEREAQQDSVADVRQQTESASRETMSRVTLRDYMDREFEGVSMFVSGRLRAEAVGFRGALNALNELLKPSALDVEFSPVQLRIFTQTIRESVYITSASIGYTEPCANIRTSVILTLATYINSMVPAAK